MNISFQWEPEEWHEALSLASTGPRRPPKPVMTYAVIGIMALGGTGEMVHAVRSASFSDYGDSLMPLLLFAVAVVIAVQVYSRAASRNRCLRPSLPMPLEQQRVVLNEKGWHAAPAGKVADVTIRPWDELREQRTGRKSLILVGRGNAFAALPLRVLSPEQGGHLRRLLVRKMQRPR